MADQLLTLAPTGGAALSISAPPYKLGMELDWGEAAVEAALAEGPDIVGGVVGTRRQVVREPSLPLAVDGRGGTAAAYLAAAEALAAAVTRLQQYGGSITRQVEFASGVRSEPLTLTILNANLSSVDDDWLEAHRLYGAVTLSLTCQPQWLAAEAQVATVAASTATLIDLPIPTLRGNMKGPGRIVIKDNATTARKWAEVGASFEHYNAAAVLEFRAAAFSLTGTDGALVADSAAIGAQTIEALPLWQGWQTVAFVNDIPHKGSYRIRLRAKADSEDFVVRHRLVWRAGSGPWRTIESEPVPVGPYRDLDFGSIHHYGDEGLIDLRVDVRASAFTNAVPYLLNTLTLMPTEVYAVAQGGWESQTPSTAVLADDFATVADNAALVDRVAPLGGTWAEAGMTGIWLGSAARNSYIRAGTSDTDTGRFATLGTTNYTIAAAIVQCKLLFTNAVAGKEGRIGALLRYVDTSNWLAAVLRIRYTAGGEFLCFVSLYKNVAGVVTRLQNRRIPGLLHGRYLEASILLLVASNRYEVRIGGYRSTTAPKTLWKDTDSSLSGALATGKMGVYHLSQHNSINSQGAFRRLFGFTADSPAVVIDVVRSGGLGVLTHERAYSATVAGADTQDVSSYQGQRVLLPGGKAGRVAAKVRSGDPEVDGDTGAGLSTDLTVYHRPAFATLSDAIA